MELGVACRLLQNWKLGNSKQKPLRTSGLLTPPPRHAISSLLSVGWKKFRQGDSKIGREGVMRRAKGIFAKCRPQGDEPSVDFEIGEVVLNQDFFGSFFDRAKRHTIFRLVAFGTSEPDGQASCVG